MVSKLRDLQSQLGYLHLQESPRVESESLSGLETVTTANHDKVMKAKSYCISGMSVENKMSLLNMKIEDVKAHLEFLKCCEGVNIFMEAVNFAKNKKTWKFWECCVCEEKYGDLESYCNHFDGFHQVHIGKDFEIFLSETVDGETIEFILHGVWKPINTDEAIKIIIKRSKSESSNTVNEEWPLSNDNERTENLEKIRGILQWLLKRECLYVSHVEWVKNSAIAEISTKIPESKLEIEGLLTLKLICFSGVSQLKYILAHMNDWISVLADLSENPQDDQLSGEQMVVHFKERVVFTRDDFSCLLLDKQLLQGEPKMVDYGGSEGTSGDDACKDDELPDGDEFVSWLYAGKLTVEEAVESWTSLRDSIKGVANRVYEMQKNECLQLERLFMRKRQNEINLDAFQDIKDIFLDELLKMEVDPNYERQTLAALLIEHEKHLRIGLDVISNLLEEQSEEPNFRMQEHLNQEEVVLDIQCRLQELENMIKELTDNLFQCDALIMRSHSALITYKRQLAQASAYDYRSIMLPLLKSFMQSRLEDQIDKNHGEV